MSESEIINVYSEGVQAVISLVQGLLTQNSGLDARLQKLEKQLNKTKGKQESPTFSRWV